MAVFQPCQGKTACRDDGVRCLTCGRELNEIGRLRDLMEQLTNLAIDYDYRNTDVFCDYVARKLDKSIAYRRQDPEL
jgi:hypothetical protein